MQKWEYGTLSKRLSIRGFKGFNTFVFNGTCLFECLTNDNTQGKNIQSLLDQLGKDGGELVGFALVHDNTPDSKATEFDWVFKRPVM